MKMKEMTLDSAARAVGGEYIGREYTGAIRDIALDSRKVGEGSLFVAIRGERSDGHDYINESFKKGACCALSEKVLENPGGPYILVDSTLRAIRDLAEYYRSLFDIKVIGVTGSVGKTTTKEMLYSILSQKYRVHKTEGNYNNEIGVPITLFGLREEHDAAIVEMGISHFGEMRRLTKMVKPDIVVMSVIGYSHLEFLGSREGVLRAKGEIFEYADQGCLAVLNGDDDLLRDMALGNFCENPKKMKKLLYGIGEKNDFRAENIRNLGAEGVECAIHRGEKRFTVHIPAFGSHMVYAALAGAAVGDSLGLNGEEIARGVSDFQNVGKRADITNTGYITIIDDCYNANPNSVKASIDSLAGLPGRRVCILGDMAELGKDGEALHYEMGKHVALSGINCLICTGALAENIYRGAKDLNPQLEMWYLPEKAEAVAVIPSVIRKGDSVLVKASRSMRFEDVVSALKAIEEH